MTIYGAGTMPVGLGPVGLWYDDEEVLAAPDPTALSLAYDGASRGYSYDATTRQLTQMSGPLQRVALLLTTQEWTAAALPEMGVRRPVVHSSDFVADREAAVRSSLRQLTDVEKSIRIDEISTIVDGSRSRTHVTFTSLDTGVQERATL